MQIKYFKYFILSFIFSIRIPFIRKRQIASTLTFGVYFVYNIGIALNDLDYFSTDIFFDVGYVLHKEPTLYTFSNYFSIFSALS